MRLSRELNFDEEYDSDPVTSFATSASSSGVGSSSSSGSSSSKQKIIPESDDDSDSGSKRKRDNDKSPLAITTPKKRKTDSDDEEESTSAKRVTRSSSSSKSKSEPSSETKPVRRMIDKKRSKKIQSEDPENAEVDEDSDQAEGEYEVEAILLKKPKKTQPSYLVKWKHWSIKDSSWEPQSHLEKLTEMLEKFEKEIYPQFSIEYKKGKCKFVHDKVLNSRKYKNSTEYLVQWKDFPINTWEPENEVPFKFISRYNKSTSSYKKVVVSKSSSISSVKSTPTDTMVSSDDEASSSRSSSSKKHLMIEPEDNDIEIPPPPSQSSTPKKSSFLSEKELAELDFEIMTIKKRNNTIQFLLQDNDTDETYLTDVNCLRGKATVQKLVDFLLGKVVFEKNAK